MTRAATPLAMRGIVGGLEHPAIRRGRLARNEEGVPDDFRVLSIFGGTTEIQKEIIARGLGL